MASIYTIGYGNRKIEDFLTLLQKVEVRYLIDIRTAPYSKFNPDFSQKALKGHLAAVSIQYVLMGHELGGRPTDADCYTPEGYVYYPRVMEKLFFKTGIERVKKALDSGLRMALMCSELRPEECHRFKLVGRKLHQDGVDVIHMDERGDLKSQAELETLFNKPRQLSLFDEYPTYDPLLFSLRPGREKQAEE